MVVYHHSQLHKLLGMLVCSPLSVPRSLSLSWRSWSRCSTQSSSGWPISWSSTSSSQTPVIPSTSPPCWQRVKTLTHSPHCIVYSCTHSSRLSTLSAMYVCLPLAMYVCVCTVYLKGVHSACLGAIIRRHAVNDVDHIETRCVSQSP